MIFYVLGLVVDIKKDSNYNTISVMLCTFLNSD